VSTSRSGLGRAPASYRLLNGPDRKITALPQPIIVSAPLPALPLKIGIFYLLDVNIKNLKLGNSQLAYPILH